jgi:hypothetical protein
MIDPKCAFCGHVNRADSEVCESCDFPLTEADDHAPREPHNTYGDAYGGATRAGSAAVYARPVTFGGVGDVFKPTLEVYRSHFLLVGLLVVVTTLPVALLQYASVRAVTSAMPGDTVEIRSAFNLMYAGMALSWLLSLAGSALLSGGLAYAVLDLRGTGEASAGECLRRALKALPRLFVVNLLYAAVVGVGYVLLVVPGVILSIALALVVPVAVAEGRGPIASLKRSMELTSGYKGLIFLTYFLWGLAITVLDFIITASFSHGGHMNSVSAVAAHSLITGMLNSSTAVLTVYIFLGLLYERSHGFDGRAFTYEGDAAGR